MGASGPLFGPANADPDHFTYTYDREGKVTSEASPQNTNFSQTYTYDALNRLTSSMRGRPCQSDVGLDGKGNMATVTMTSSTPQSRTVNAANEIAAFSGIVTPLYDAAGNTIYGPSACRGSRPRRSTASTTPGTAWWRSTPTTARAAWAPRLPGPVRRPEPAGQKSLFDPSGNPTGGDQDDYNQNGQVIEDDSVDTNGVAQSIYQYARLGSAAPLVCLHDGNANGERDPRRLPDRLAAVLPDRRQRQRHDDDQVGMDPLRLRRHPRRDAGDLHGLRDGDRDGRELARRR